MRLRDWKAAALGRHSIYSNKVNDICLRSSPCRYQIKDIEYFQNLHNTRKIPGKVYSETFDTNIAIIELDKNNNFQKIGSCMSGDMMFRDLSSSSVYVMRVSDIRFSILRSIADQKSNFAVFTDDRPTNISIIKQMPSNWKKGIIFHALCQISFNESKIVKGNLFKLYISKWKETLYLLTNIKEIKIDSINRLADGLSEF